MKWPILVSARTFPEAFSPLCCVVVDAMVRGEGEGHCVPATPCHSYEYEYTSTYVELLTPKTRISK